MSYNTLFANKSQAAVEKGGLVKVGYGQVEPNHLSARRTGQIYAQLPANKNYTLLENGQFAKYDYATGEVNKTGEGEWMLVFNEIKLYRDNQADCEFAMIPGDYIAQYYSPASVDDGVRSPSGIDWSGITAPEDVYELFYNTNPDFFDYEKKAKGQKMPEGTRMVPRLFKTNVGDIYTTNLVLLAKADGATEPTPIEVGDKLTVNNDGILAVTTANADDAEMVWQVAKVYTMPDNQPGVKIVRIK